MSRAEKVDTIEKKWNEFKQEIESEQEKNENTNFEFLKLDNIIEVRTLIQQCQGKHVQQVAYSTYHDALTQICFTCRVIRSNIDLPEY